MVNQTGYGKRTLSTPTWPYTGITARQNIATSDLQRSMNDWTPHHPADVNHVSSETKRHQTETNRNTTNWNKNVITLVANGRTMIANGAVLCKTDAATHAWSGIIFPLSAILGQHVGSHNPQQDTTGDRTGGYITSKMSPNLCTKQPTRTMPYHTTTCE